VPGAGARPLSRAPASGAQAAYRSCRVAALGWRRHSWRRLLARDTPSAPSARTRRATPRESRAGTTAPARSRSWSPSPDHRSEAPRTRRSCLRPRRKSHPLLRRCRHRLRRRHSHHRPRRHGPSLHPRRRHRTRLCRHRRRRGDRTCRTPTTIRRMGSVLSEFAMAAMSFEDLLAAFRHPELPELAFPIGDVVFGAAVTDVLDQLGELVFRHGDSSWPRRAGAEGEAGSSQARARQPRRRPHQAPSDSAQPAAKSARPAVQPCGR